MIGYTSIGTNNLATSGAFYDAILGMMGAKRVMEMEDFIVWARAEGEANFSVHLPFDGRRATVGNGVMIALQGKSKDEVDAVYSKAISVGAVSEGNRARAAVMIAVFTQPIFAIRMAIKSTFITCRDLPETWRFLGENG